MKSHISMGFALSIAVLLIAGMAEANRGGRMLRSSEAVSSGVGSDSDGNDIITNSESSELSVSGAIGFSQAILLDPGVLGKRKLLQTTEQVEIIEVYIQALLKALSVPRDKITCTSHIGEQLRPPSRMRQRNTN